MTYSVAIHFTNGLTHNYDLLSGANVRDMLDTFMGRADVARFEVLKTS